MFIYETGCMVVNRIGVVKNIGFIFFVRVGGNKGIFTGERIWIEETTCSMDSSIKTIKATLSWPIMLG
mgnify:CR=1 FL=1